MKIKCTNCNASYEINDSTNIPTTCAHCHEDLEWKEIKEQEDNTNAEIVNLIWTKQSDSSSFNVSKSSNALHFIGRLHHGSEFLANILKNNVPIISRKHCSIEFSEDKVFIKDEYSANGTFIGLEKINCADKKRLKDNDWVWLATEAFTVTFEYKIQNSSEIIKSENLENQGYRCNQCGLSFDVKPDDNICENCGVYNSLVVN